MKLKTKSILEMAKGAFLERVDVEIKKVIDNIRDPMTSAKAKRKINMTLVFEPDNDRNNITVWFEVKSALSAMNPSKTTLYIAGESSDGIPRVLEMTAQEPGQLDMFGGEEPQRAQLRIIRANGNAEETEKYTQLTNA